MSPITINSLPLELLLRIVSFCGVWDIHSLLEAFPFLKQHTVIIADHARSPMFFGGIEGVSRVNALSSEDIKFKFTEKVRGQKSFSIKLVEITKYEMFDAWARFIDAEESPLQNGQYWVPHFDNKTFVYLNGYNASTASMFKLRRAVADHRRLTWHMGMPKYPIVLPYTYVETELPTFRSIRNIYTNSLVSLRVQGMNEFSGHHFPSLRHLMVDFSRLAADDSTYQPVRGSLKDLTLPALVSMVVYYRKHPPSFRNIDVMTKVEKRFPLYFSYCGEPGPHTTFELTDATCGTHGSEPYTQSENYWSDLDYDMGFTSRFGVLSFNRVPCQLIEKCDLARATQLQFTVAHPSHYPALEAMKKRKGSNSFLAYFVVTVCCDDWKLPFPNSDDCPNLNDVQVLSLARNVDLSQVLSEDFLAHRKAFYYVRRILVHSNQTASHGGEIVSPFEISLAERVVDLHGIELSQRVERKHRSEERRVMLYEHEGIGDPALASIYDPAIHSGWAFIKDPSVYDISA